MFHKIINRVDDKLNPILVKELRQSTNSRMLTVLVIAFLGIQLFSLYIQVFMNDATSFDSRQAIFSTVLTILIASCIYGIIPTISNRFYKERNGDSIDLIYTTVLSPFAIITGKMFSAMGLIILLYSLCAPFIFISYLFPGVDILTIAWSLWYSFWLIVAIAQLMILLATIKTSKIMRSIIMLVYFVIATIWGFGLLQAMIFSYHSRGLMGSLGIGSTVWYWQLCIMIFWLLGIGFLYILSVSAVTSTHANRALCPRIYAAGFWLIGLLFVVGSSLFSSKYATSSVGQVWLILSTIVFIAFLGVASGERAEYGKRLRKFIPRNRLLRSIAFPFFSGEVNGIIYSIFFLSVTVVIFYLLPHKTIRLDKNVTVIVGLAGYFVWYCLLALQIKRMFVNKFPNINSFLIMLFAVIAFTLIPMMLAWGIHHGIDLRDDEIAPFLILSFGIMLVKGYTFLGLICGWSLSGLTLIILLPFLRRRIKEFKPLEQPVDNSEDAENNG
jgi:hypothetical protein